MGGALGSVEDVGDLVGEDAVDLLGHAAVVAAQAGLHMHHRELTLAGHQRAGERGVDVAHHQHRARAVLVDDRLEALHHLGGLHRMRAGADREVDVGFGQVEVGEQAVLHRRVVVLAGVHQQRADRRIVRGEGADDRRDLHVVRAGADDADHRCRGGGVGVHRVSSSGAASRRTACSNWLSTASVADTDCSSPARRASIRCRS